MKYLSKGINLGFGTAFFIGILCAVVNMYFICSKHSNLAALAVITVLLSAIIICYTLSKLEKYLENTKSLCRRIMICLPILLLAFQILFVIAFDFTPKNDLSYICKGAENYVKYGVDSIYNGLPERHQHYFAVYPNNHMLFMLVAGLYKLTYVLTGEISNFLPTLINVLSLNIAYIFMLKTANLIYKPERAVICGLRGLMFTPIITYATFFYTDSLAMPFVSAAIYFYIKSRRESNTKKSLLFLTLCGAITALGYEMKGSLIILLSAILFDLLLHRYGVKAVAARAGTMLITFTVLATVISTFAAGMLNISKEEKCRYEFPEIHWVMMSADGKGGYNAEDFLFTKSYDGYENKVTADMDRLVEKLKTQGVVGFGSHILKKIGYTWSNGTYMVPYYNQDSKFLNSTGFMAVAEILHFSVLFMTLRGFIYRRKFDNDVISENLFLKICLVGLFVFLLIWESRCRYVVSFFSLFSLI